MAADEVMVDGRSWEVRVEALEQAERLRGEAAASQFQWAMNVEQRLAKLEATLQRVLGASVTVTRCAEGLAEAGIAVEARLAALEAHAARLEERTQGLVRYSATSTGLTSPAAKAILDYGEAVVRERGGEAGAASTGYVCRACGAVIRHTGRMGAPCPGCGRSGTGTRETNRE